MQKLLLLTLLSSLAISGCSNMISASREGPIAKDSGSRSVGAYIDDELIETIAQINISKGSNEIRQANIGVTSYNGQVLLTGQVSSEEVKREAEAIAAEVRNVKNVYNELKITGVTSAIALANDAWLTTKVKSTLLSDEKVNGNRVKVVTENGTVYLMGLVTQTEADAVVQIVRGIAGVQRIIKIFEYI